MDANSSLLASILDVVADSFTISVNNMWTLIVNYCPQEVGQSVGTTPNEAEVSSSNPSPPSCVNMSKKKKNSELLASKFS
jgi:hypothetical protein